MAKEGVIDILKAYRELMIRAETLLKIFEDEKEKRGRFTYRTIPQDNKLPAMDSIGHARFFLSHMAALAGEAG